MRGTHLVRDVEAFGAPGVLLGARAQAVDLRLGTDIDAAVRPLCRRLVLPEGMRMIGGVSLKKLAARLKTMQERRQRR